MRRSLIPAGALIAAMAGSLVLAPAASATGKQGDNGTVKIHDAKTGEELRKNEPKVCAFYLDAFGFDAGQKVNWRIEAWANNDQDKGTTVKSGLITLDADGQERTEDMTLPNGQYKLFWNWEGENGRAKHKVFKTDCPPGEPTPGETPGTETPGTESPGTETPGTETPGTENPSGTPSESATPGTPGSTETPGAAPSASTGTDSATGDLAETGSSAPVGIIAAAALALAGAGSVLVLRRRKAQG
ncbi:LPXTG cell wall anchor domain-containing protein [Streptomyces sp. P9(2023)]|uniref:LPXTG cell wall anchor domain-containing protein n=1 Tax=Streptomyces sp. P9(2023) TaxID=3064394 RepID=UPI0028F4024E|nr:LPXTG cell wall anchor domain-containing protein [Streptomyces sp. P9(2023)]MDT9692136.1 LPXTG cell wall anchor domain-containing protein [Streptomyces sp. P9(2023)]